MDGDWEEVSPAVLRVRFQCRWALDILSKSTQRGSSSSSSLDDFDILDDSHYLHYTMLMQSALTGRAPAPSASWASGHFNACNNTCFRQLPGAALGWESIWASL